jgi:Type IV secretory pathway, VirB6 components
MDGVISNFLSTIDSGTQNFVQSTYGVLGGEIRTILNSLLTLYIILWGYQVGLGKSRFDGSDIFMRFARVAVIVGLVINWEWFSFYVYEFATNFPEKLGNVILSGIKDNTAHDNHAIVTGLNKVYNKAVELVDITYTGSYFDILGALLAVFVLACAFVFLAIAAGLIIAAKILMAITLALAPLFITCGLFGFTTRYMDGWINVVVTYMVALVLVYAFLGFYISILETVINFAKPSEGSGDSGLTIKLQQITPFMLVSFVGIYVLSQIQALARTIAGGQVSDLSGGTQAGRAIMNTVERSITRTAAAITGAHRTQSNNNPIVATSNQEADDEAYRKRIEDAQRPRS